MKAGANAEKPTVLRTAYWYHYRHGEACHLAALNRSMAACKDTKQDSEYEDGLAMSKERGMTADVGQDWAAKKR